MFKVIAVTGLKRSGKDTICDFISKEYGYEHVKISSKLKSILKLSFDLDDDDLESSRKDTIHPRLRVSPRTLMDFFGTHIFQYELNKIMPTVGRTFWIDDLLSKGSNGRRIVISDLRFHHEVEILKKYPDCLILRVNRQTIAQSEYSSEKEIASLVVDHEIENNGSLQSLYDSVNTILKRKKL